MGPARFGRLRVSVFSVLFVLGVVARCGPAPGEGPGAPSPGAAEEAVDWAIAIHGGAGSSPDARTAEENARYLESLRAALDLGASILEEGGSGLDAVEQVIRRLEDDPLFNAGKGAVFNREGSHELDASVMDGAGLGCGAVAGVTSVKNPISLARLVMERTRHVLLAADGAERFAKEMGVERVGPDYFFTEERYRALQRMLDEERRAAPAEHGTVGAVALDRQGNLAAGTSTGGLTGKRSGRVGDSPIVGAGTYADNATCAVSGTGVGEEFIRYGVALRISTLMRYRGLTLQDAADHVVHELLRPGTGGVIALDGSGNVTAAFNTEGMARGFADSRGRREVHLGR